MRARGGWALAIGLLCAALLLAAFAGAGTEQPPRKAAPDSPYTITRSITIDAAQTYSHGDAANTLLSALNTPPLCTGVEWSGDPTRFAHFEGLRWGNGDRGDPWNGLYIYVEQRRAADPRHWIVGSALETGVSNVIRGNVFCRQEPRRGGRNGSARTVAFTVSVTGRIPAHVAPESVYHGVRLTDGLHPEASHRTHAHIGFVPQAALDAANAKIAALEARLLAAERYYGEQLCIANPSGRWDTAREWADWAEQTAAAYVAIPETVRKHCCLASDPDQTTAQCFAPTAQGQSPPAQAPAPSDGAAPTPEFH